MDSLCKYPNCDACEYPDCIIKEDDLDKQYHAYKQREYRNRVKNSLPVCDNCAQCALVRSDDGRKIRRLCMCDMRLIEPRIAASPHWCSLR